MPLTLAVSWRLNILGCTYCKRLKRGVSESRVEKPSPVTIEKISKTNFPIYSQCHQINLGHCYLSPRLQALLFRISWIILNRYPYLLPTWLSKMWFSSCHPSLFAVANMSSLFWHPSLSEYETIYLWLNCTLNYLFFLTIL